MHCIDYTKLPSSWKKWSLGFDTEMNYIGIPQEAFIVTREWVKIFNDNSSKIIYLIAYQWKIYLICITKPFKE